MSDITVDQKRYDLINQGYTPFIHDCPAVNTMLYIIEKERSIYWHVVQKKYFILEHTMIIGGLKVRLKIIKKHAKIL